MFTVELPSGQKIECATEKELKREIRKAKKIEDENFKENERKGKQARKESMCVGFNLLDRFVDEKSVPFGWRFLPPEKMHRKPYPEVTSFGKVWHKCTYETEGGTSEFEHYGYIVRGIIENGSGFAMAVLLTENAGDKNSHLFAIGIFEDKCVLTSLPNELIAFYCVEKNKEPKVEQS